MTSAPRSILHRPVGARDVEIEAVKQLGAIVRRALRRRFFLDASHSWAMEDAVNALIKIAQGASLPRGVVTNGDEAPHPASVTRSPAAGRSSLGVRSAGPAQ